MDESEKELSELRQKLVLLKFRMDEDVPNHGFESALALASEAGGVERAIQVVEERLQEIKKKREFRLNQPNMQIKKKPREIS